MNISDSVHGPLDLFGEKEPNNFNLIWKKYAEIFGLVILFSLSTWFVLIIWKKKFWRFIVFTDR